MLMDQKTGDGQDGEYLKGCIDAVQTLAVEWLRFTLKAFVVCQSKSDFGENFSFSRHDDSSKLSKTARVTSLHR
jgi:hypothetical protein